jgi:hypothetical protein
MAKKRRSWRSILNTAKDIALPTIGFAFGGPAGAAAGGALAGATGRGRPKAKNIAIGAGSGYLGGQLGSAIGLKGNQGLGTMGGSVKDLFTAGGARGAMGGLGDALGKGGQFLDKYGNIIQGGLGVVGGMREGDRASKESAYEREMREREFAQNFAQRQAEFERRMALEEAEAERKREEEMYRRQQAEARSQRVTEQLAPFLNAMRNR